MQTKNSLLNAHKQVSPRATAPGISKPKINRNSWSSKGPEMNNHFLLSRESWVGTESQTPQLEHFQVSHTQTHKPTYSIGLMVYHTHTTKMEAKEQDLECVRVSSLSSPSWPQTRHAAASAPKSEPDKSPRKPASRRYPEKGDALAPPPLFSHLVGLQLQPARSYWPRCFGGHSAEWAG